MNAVPSVETLVTDHLDLWTAALKRKSTAGRGSSRKVELYGIKKLRELILELAVRGLLVPQDPNDEPASELLKKIAAEKAGLVKAGKIKKEVSLPPTKNDEKPNFLPSGWHISRLGEIFSIVYGKGLSTKELTPDGYPVFGANGIIGSYRTYLYEDEQLLVSCRGAYSGKPNISPPKCFVTSNSLVLENDWKLLSRKYFYYVLTVADKSQIVTGSAQPQVTTTNLEPLVVVIPPLAEQHRIVAKVDELMALCDQLEQQTDASLGAHQTLVETLLDALTSAADHAQFASAWQRIAGHFNTLFTTEESIAQLKQSILQLAVMGKLVPQDPRDEPASELLKKIAAEKGNLVKDGKIKKERLLPPVGDAEAPYKLPQGWAWIRLGQCGVCSTGKTPSTNEPKYYGGDIPFIGPGQISIDGELSAPEKFVSEAGLEESTKAQPNDIFMVCIGGSIGKAAIADKQLAFNQQINAIRPIQISSKYLYVAVSSKHFTDGVIAQATGSATPIINRFKWEELPVPICSIQEQNRIVAKVDELMALCDQLKSRLSDAQTTQLHLADALVERAIC